jgi:hypothetical protein
MHDRRKCNLKNINLPGENTVENSCDPKLGKDLLVVTPKSQFIKEKNIDKLDFIIIKNHWS